MEKEEDLTSLPEPVANGQNRPRIAFTMGDPNGIGPEVILKCLTERRLLKYFEPVIIASHHVLKYHASALGFGELPLNFTDDLTGPGQDQDTIVVLDPDPGSKPHVTFGEITEAGGRLSMSSVDRATALCLNGNVDGMVTAPISKEAISLAGFTNKGHSEYLAEQTQAGSYTMMMVSDSLKVGLVTEHVPLFEVPRMITPEAILAKIKIIAASLVNDFGIDRPRIAVLGLNPHAGDGGVLGDEEVNTLVPAISQACEAGHLVFGPFPADGFFAIADYRNYHAVLAMYHDQGLIPFKTISFGLGVNFTAGLPIVRTSPDHGTAFGIAGKGEASPRSIRSALYLALDIARRRKSV